MLLWDALSPDNVKYCFPTVLLRFYSLCMLSQLIRHKLLTTFFSFLKHTPFASLKTSCIILKGSWDRGMSFSFVAASVCWGYANKVPQTGLLKQRNSVSQIWRIKVQDQVRCQHGSVSPQGSLLGLQMAAAPCVFTGISICLFLQIFHQYLVVFSVQDFLHLGWIYC